MEAAPLGRSLCQRRHYGTAARTVFPRPASDFDIFRMKGRWISVTGRLEVLRLRVEGDIQGLDFRIEIPKDLSGRRDHAGTAAKR